MPSKHSKTSFSNKLCIFSICSSCRSFFHKDLCLSFYNYHQEEDCEKAFFKMDNVLIDDRRIHVDFSQSVAKVKWKGKGMLVHLLLFFVLLCMLVSMCISFD